MSLPSVPNDVYSRPASGPGDLGFKIDSLAASVADLNFVASTADCPAGTSISPSTPGEWAEFYHNESAASVAMSTTGISATSPSEAFIAPKVSSHTYAYMGSQLVVEVDYDQEPQTLYEYDYRSRAYRLGSASEFWFEGENCHPYMYRSQLKPDKDIIEEDLLNKRLNSIDINHKKVFGKLCDELRLMLTDFDVEQSILTGDTYKYAQKLMSIMGLTRIFADDEDPSSTTYMILRIFESESVDDPNIVRLKKSKLVVMREKAAQMTLNMIEYRGLDENSKASILDLVKRSHTPERLLKTFIMMFTSVKRYHIIRDHVLGVLPDYEKSQFNDYMDLPMFMSRLKEVSEEAAYTDFQDRVLPLGKHEQIDQDIRNMTSEKERAVKYIEWIKKDKKVLREYRDNYDPSVLLMLHRVGNLETYAKWGRHFANLSFDLSKSTLPETVKLVGELEFAKLHKDDLGLSFVENILSTEDLITKGARNYDLDREWTTRLRDDADLGTGGLHQRIISIPNHLQDSPDIETLNSLFKKLNSTSPENIQILSEEEEVLLENPIYEKEFFWKETQKLIKNGCLEIPLPPTAKPKKHRHRRRGRGKGKGKGKGEMQQMQVD